MPRRRAGLLAALLAPLVLAGCSMIGDRSGTEEPRFDMLARHGEVEIRRYVPRIAAETVVEAGEDEARNIGFRRLADYIFGANRGASRIAMTAPVAQSRGTAIAMTAPVAQARADGGRSVVRFYMPAQWTMQTLPAPDNPEVRLVEVPGETMAVLRFTGDRGAAETASREAELLRLLEGSAWRPVGAPVAWFYDPPWTLPWLRRNEVAVPVASR